MIKNKELLEFYLRKSKSDTYAKKALCCENEHGFITWFPDHDLGCLVIYDVCGDGKYWDRFGTLLAKYYGFSKICFGTKRNPKAFERKYRYKLTGYILEKEVE